MDEDEKLKEFIDNGGIRVSQVLRFLSNYDHIDPEVLANKCQIGTNVHTGIESQDSEEFPYTIGKAEKGYYDSWMIWKNLVKPVFIMSERRFYCEELMITGQLDGLVMLPNHPIPVLIDFKTSASANDLSWEMQAHLYHYLLMKNRYTIISNRFLWLQLNKLGKEPKVHIYEWNMKMMNDCFKAVLKYRIDNPT